MLFARKKSPRPFFRSKLELCWRKVGRSMAQLAQPNDAFRRAQLWPDLSSRIISCACDLVNSIKALPQKARDVSIDR